MLTGPNGAGKTNLIEALYFGCTGRSCRTVNEREVVRFGQQATRVTVTASDLDGLHELSVGFAPGQPKRMRVDGADVERLLDVERRPLVSVFLPERLELVKGAPAVRRAHLDQFVAARWPARAATRRSYAQALAQRNALLARVRSGGSGRGSLATWDLALARVAIDLMADRRAAVSELTEPFSRWCGLLGLDREPRIAYRPRSHAASPDELAAELAERLDSDLERGFTGHGPHRDELTLTREGRDLRAYGSQGQQRLALLSLLLAERDVLAARRSGPPLLLLDDVMSELDARRRAALVANLRSRPGQAVITTTDPEHVPFVGEHDIVQVAVADGSVLAGAAA